jgi:hypothetical protein
VQTSGESRREKVKPYLLFEIPVSDGQRRPCAVPAIAIKAKVVARFRSARPTQSAQKRAAPTRLKELPKQAGLPV